MEGKSLSDPLEMKSGVKAGNLISSLTEHKARDCRIGFGGAEVVEKIFIHCICPSGHSLPLLFQLYHHSYEAAISKLCISPWYQN